MLQFSTIKQKKSLTGKYSKDSKKVNKDSEQTKLNSCVNFKYKIIFRTKYLTIINLLFDVALYLKQIKYK